MKSIRGTKPSRRLLIFAVFVTVIGLIWFLSNASRSTSNVIRYEAIGDSITFGKELGFEVDRRGRPQKTSKMFQGWPALLGHMLTETTGRTTEVSNNGHPGIRAIESNRQALISGSSAMHTLLMIGTNDSNTFDPTPSGKGCAGVACSNTYKEKLQSLIQSLHEAGRQSIYVGVLLPVWGTELDEPYPDPLDLEVAPRNAMIVAYNQVILDELLVLPGVRPGPDFFSCFLTPGANRFSLFEDTLHPNKLGYLLMAALWRQAIIEAPKFPPVENCPSPVYILESLDPYAHGHKQNLLEAGDAYYTDQSFVLTSIPSELESGIWVTQANADNANRDEEFLTFDAGQMPVTVYIAFDPASNPPLSGSHEFTPITLSGYLTVSDPQVGVFSFVRAMDVTGNVSIGGNKSGGAMAPQQAYVVIVVP